MSFGFRPAKRQNVPLLIGVAGGTGSGKTMSALLLARGLAGGKPFYVIDTENGRALHYADQFEFQHGELHAPFRPSRYAEAIDAAEKAKAPVIVVDSMSHEWSGDGGMLDWQEQEMRGEESRRLMSWIKPKQDHRKFVTRLLQTSAHVVLAFRAEPKVDMVKVDGKWEIVPKRSLVGLDGWIPISEKMLPYELTASFLLTADAPGVPKPIKLQEQHRAFFPGDKPITEQAGVALAAWAAGAPAASPTNVPDPAPEHADSNGAATWDDDEEVAALLRLLRSYGAEKSETWRASLERVIAQHAGGERETFVSWLKEQIDRARAAAPAGASA